VAVTKILFKSRIENCGGAKQRIGSGRWRTEEARADTEAEAVIPYCQLTIKCEQMANIRFSFQPDKFVNTAAYLARACPNSTKMTIGKQLYMRTRSTWSDSVDRSPAINITNSNTAPSRREG
jgi:hypothetical protein